jgi:ketosteroid isomerase-like protein
MKTSDEILTELSDREAIRDLPIRYCDCVWQGNLEAMLDLFAKDAVFITKGRQREAVSRGRDELRKMYQKALGDFTPRPYIHNHVVDLNGKTKATGRCYVELRSASRGMEWIGTGFYEDEYVKEGEQWKFASRRFTSFGMQPAGEKNDAQKS